MRPTRRKRAAFSSLHRPGFNPAGVLTSSPTASRPGLRFVLAFCTALLLFPAACDSPRSSSPQSGDSLQNNSTAAAEQPPISSDSWPLFRGDAAALGIARCELPETPQLLWTFSVADGGFEAGAAIDGGLVYAGSTDGNLYAVRLDNGKEAWRFYRELGFVTTPAVLGGRLYIGDGDGRFHCLDAAGGKPLWHFDSGAEINSSANFYRDRVLFGSQDSILYCLEAADGRPVWQFKSEDQIRCSPSIAAGRAFVAGCDGRLHVIDIDSGREMAAVELDSPTGCTPAVTAAHGLALVGTEAGDFLAVNWQTGKIAWRYSDPRQTLAIRSSAAVTAGAVLFGSRDKSLHAVELSAGKPLWTFPTRGRIDGSPVVAGNRVFFGSADGRVYAIHLTDGKQSWQYEAGGPITASPAVAAGRLVIGSEDGDLFCFGKK